MAAAFVPDYMMRFSPTPFRWTLMRGRQVAEIESNELGLALLLRRWWEMQDETVRSEVRCLRVVVDQGWGYGGLGPVQPELMAMENGPVRTLLCGAGTVLIHDAERGELLGFVGPDVSAAELVDRFVPMLLAAKRVNR